MSSLANQSMKHLLLAAVIAVALAACSSKPKSESGIVFDDGKTYEQVIAEPYTADKQ
jgi:type IV pilus biogenesis protein CpaD/CtpE